MAYKIAITFDAAAVKKQERESAPICAVYQPTNAACDMDVFEDTYYDTNVAGYGFGTELEDFLAMQVSHPGLVAAMKAAVDAENGKFEMETLDPSMKTMVEEMNRAMKGAGFSFEWSEA